MLPATQRISSTTQRANGRTDWRLWINKPRRNRLRPRRNSNKEFTGNDHLLECCRRVEYLEAERDTHRCSNWTDASKQRVCQIGWSRVRTFINAFESALPDRYRVTQCVQGAGGCRVGRKATATTAQSTPCRPKFEARGSCSRTRQCKVSTL